MPDAAGQAGLSKHALTRAIAERGVKRAIHVGSRERFFAHAKRSEVLADIGLTPVKVAGWISAGLAARDKMSKDGLSKEKVNAE